MSRSKPRSRSVIHVYCRDSCRPAFFEVIRGLRTTGPLAPWIPRDINSPFSPATRGSISRRFFAADYIDGKSSVEFR